ncbi:MAG: hypothetical protein LCH63_13350 [Candidatus Melainabacteria bacterium]|nr:hypothetical protein [Candidatus Melainabacteria bacterium]
MQVKSQRFHLAFYLSGSLISSKMRFGFATFGHRLKSYSTTVVKTGDFGQGKAQPAIQIIGKRATCKLRATQKAWNRLS